MSTFPSHIPSAIRLIILIFGDWIQLATLTLPSPLCPLTGVSTTVGVPSSRLPIWWRHRNSYIRPVTTMIRKHTGVRYLSLVFYYANLLLDMIVRIDTRLTKLWRSLTLVLLQSLAFTLKILLATLRSSYNYAAVKIGNIACQQATL